MVIQYAIAIMFCIVLMPSVAYAQSAVQVEVEKAQYVVGDYFSFTLVVPEVIQDTATLDLIHELKGGGAPINIPVPNMTSVYPSSEPFDSTYPAGEWTLSITYGAHTVSDTFMLAESENVLLPKWTIDVADLWSKGVITDAKYAELLFFLYDTDIIQDKVPPTTNSIQIPAWFKDTATPWWVQGHINDLDYINIIEYLVPEIIILK